ncbi:O-antigen translocase [Kaistella antarctica]|uniref:O-antigen translocase n=1 Tax=Kaistella antarctica TaxID=266748 RepID=A0A3S4V2M2_9FLAO|nr:O-antigen translocase [Kaistella antarctica]KEY18776.1 O-antigen translocase [Kaistella antarctica]SEW15560.1 Membrane protein involved in the export of O-antigen and teichoic acid [Kaistella antarctica]VEH99533.1 O-antigen translocase [Kaistella antarctica]
MKEQQSSYRQVMKATSIFGGAQVFLIIIGIIRSKFIAVLLGPLGMGIAGLLTTTIGFIAALTNFGLSTSAVKDIAEAHNSGDEERLRTVSTVFKRWVWVTGLVGAILTAALSPWLSELTFGNRKYTFAFIWISVTLLLNQISSGQGVMLRGMRKIGYMAKSSMIGSVIGLFTTIPLYYIYGIKGIVPAIIISAITSLVLTWYFARKLNIKPIFVSKSETLTEGKGMLKMGFMISLSGLITVGASYIVRVFISNQGGIEQVGLYTAGFAIINSYVGMIFTAMAADYYPRLSAVSNSNSDSKGVINQQAEISLLIIAPIIIVFLVFINWVVILLYSKQFLPVTDMLYWAALGMLFKAGSWSIGFIFLAKGKSQLFFWNELIANIYLLGLNLLGYYLLGLTGLGLSFLVGYLLYFIQVYWVAKVKFEFSFDIGFIRIFSVQVILAMMCYLSMQFLTIYWAYGVGAILIVISTWYSFNELDKRMDVQSVLVSLKTKFKK